MWDVEGKALYSIQNPRPLLAHLLSCLDIRFCRPPICFVCHSSAEEASECSTQELCMRVQPHFHLLAQCLMANLTCSRLTVRSFFIPLFFQLAHIPRYRLRTVTARECGRSVAAVRVCYESRSWGLELSSRRPA